MSKPPASIGQLLKVAIDPRDRGDRLLATER